MLLLSEITGKEYDVKTYPMEKVENVRGISHDSLQDILENQLEGVSYSMEILAASEKYCAVKCVIEDDSGRKVQRVSDINVENVASREASQQNFAKEHPLIAAVNSAIDNAIKAYLKFPKTISNDEYEAFEELEKSKDKDTLTDAISNDSPSENVAEFNGEKSISERIEELGQIMAPSSSKYKDKTLAEIWEINQGWFNYIKNSNRSDTYTKAREFAKLKEMEKEQP